MKKKSILIVLVAILLFRIPLHSPTEKADFRIKEWGIEHRVQS